MARITLTLDAPLEADCDVILGLPIDTPEQCFLGFSSRDIQLTRELKAKNSGQCAMQLSVLKGAWPEVVLEIADEPRHFPDWVFTPTGGAHETPSDALIALMAEIAPASLSSADRVERIVRHVEARFTYGVREIGLADDGEAMPALACDIHLGTCVDTHSYAVSAMRAAGIEAAYISGLHCLEGANHTMPGHCWFVVRAEAAPHHWDISHFLKYKLGPVLPVFNPKPGYRCALSVGRDLVFEGPDGPVTFPRLSGFAVLNGPQKGEKLTTLAEISG